MFKAPMILASCAVLSYFLWPVMLIFYIGCLLAFMLLNLHKKLQKWHFPSWLAALCSVLLLLSVLYAVSVFLVSSLLQQFYGLTAKINSGDLQLPQILTKYISAEEANRYYKQLQQSISQNLYSIGSYLIGAISSQGVNVLVFSLHFYLTITFCFFILKDWDKFPSFARRILPIGWGDSLLSMIYQIQHNVTSLIKGQFAIMCIMFCFYSLFLYIAGTGKPAFFAALYACASFVPYVGAISALAYSLMYTLNHTPEFYSLLSVVLAYLAGSALESGVLSPYFLGMALKIHPLLFLTYTLSLGSLFGVGGFILALPSSVVLHTIGKRILAQFTQKVNKKNLALESRQLDA